MVTTAVLTNTLDLSIYTISALGVFFKPDGTKMYILNNTGVAPYASDSVLQLSIGTAWDITTQSFDKQFSV